MRSIKVTLACVALFASGCAGTDTADKAATLAVDQLSRYEIDVNAKIRVENDYYDQVMENAVDRINRLRESEHDVKLTALAREFAKDHERSDQADIERDVPGFFAVARKDWGDREREYEQLTAKTQATLAENRKKLEIEQAKIGQLKAKLRALNEPQSTADMLKLAIAFAKEAKAKFDEASKTPTKGESAASGAPSDTSK